MFAASEMCIQDISENPTEAVFEKWAESATSSGSPIFCAHILSTAKIQYRLLTVNFGRSPAAEFTWRMLFWHLENSFLGLEDTKTSKY